MSNTSQGPGWWLASDNKWYAPEQAPPSAAPVATAPPMPVGAPAPQGPGWYQATDGRWYPPQSGMGLPPVAPKKKFYQRVWFWLLVVVVLGFSGCLALITGGSVAINNANHKIHTVVYSVTGTGSASITYDSFDNNHNGSTQNSSVPLPWTKTIKGSGLFNYYSISATLGSDGGSTSCTITVDGKQVSSNSATGAFASATCSGSAP
jgi:hypothetical protein